jgi:3-deoxy-D-manno-octulosonic-acid transferase
MGFGDVSRYVLESGGLAIPSCRRSLWVHGDTPLQFDAARQLIQAVMAERPHVRLVVTSQRHETLRYLRSTFVDEQTLPAPYDAPLVVGRFIRRLKVRHLILLDGGRSLPSHAIHIAVLQRIPVSAVNIGSPAALDGALLVTARRHPEVVRFCVFDEEVARQLCESGIAAVNVAVTGCLDLEEGRGARRAGNTAVRRLLHVGEDTPLAAAVDVPREEEGLVLDSFAKARRGRSGVRLLLEPRQANRLAGLRTEILRRGWIPVTWVLERPASERHWDVLLTESPGGLTTLLPAAAAVITGGTHSSGASGAYLAATISAGATALVGPCREFEDVPWRFLKASPFVRPIEHGDLAPALCATLQGSPSQLYPAAAPLLTASTRTHAALSGTLPDNPQLPIVAQDWKVPTLRDKGGSSRAWRWVAKPLMRNRIDCWGDLGARLGHPRSVLCLGNGPSSEDPQVAGFSHQCLMRVNWRWKGRGFLVDPHVVFVGDPAAVHKVKHAVFGFWNASLEYGMLLRHLIARGPTPMEYFTMERISTIVRDQTWLARPTNGALMIAAAAALAPERLFIAGVDLYLHPDGRYPGDMLANNQYAHAHSRDTDLAIIREALAQYQGELIILGNHLRSALENPGGTSRAGC